LVERVEAAQAAHRASSHDDGEAGALDAVRRRATLVSIVRRVAARGRSVPSDAFRRPVVRVAKAGFAGPAVGIGSAAVIGNEGTCASCARVARRSLRHLTPSRSGVLRCIRLGWMLFRGAFAPAAAADPGQ